MLVVYIENTMKGLFHLPKRGNCYFGLHFDFHAIADTKGIGTKTVAEKFGEYLDTVKPEYVQIDTKGHPGYTSFFSAYGDVAPGLEVDHLKILREETAKRGILLIAHHSGIYDKCACRNHPEWAVVHADGTPDVDNTDPTSPYADEKLIPQLKELALKYKLDGVWLDGDCWASFPSFRPAEVEKFYQESGFDHIDEEATSPSRMAFKAYWREKFIGFLKHVMSEVKKDAPHFEMTSNWMFGLFAPQKPIDEIDYLSGDATFAHEARMGARCFAVQDRPWDIMSWCASDCTPDEKSSFTAPAAQKHVSRLMREASFAISQGGGYQIVNSMTKQGEIRMVDMEHMATIADFVRARKEWLYKGAPLKNVAVLYSDCDHFYKNGGDRLYWPSQNARYLCDIALDGGRPADVVFDYHVTEGLLADRQTVIVPDAVCLSDEIKQGLVRFAENGGNLVVTGVDACEMFAKEVGVSYKRDVGVFYISEGGYFYNAIGDKVLFAEESGTPLVTAFEGVMAPTAPSHTLAITKPFGKGSVTLIGWDMIADYCEKHRAFERDTMRRILDTVDTKPWAYLEKGTNSVEIVPLKKDGKLCVSLINMIEYYSDVYGSGYGEIPPLCDLTIAIKTDKAPQSVTLQPENITPNYTFDGEYIHVDVEKFGVHTIIVVE